MSSNIINLYGGSIVAQLSSNYIDASTIRIIPDHQEVFIYSINNVDVSIIIELLDMHNNNALNLSNNDSINPIRYHFEDLATMNESIENIILSEDEIHNDTFLSNFNHKKNQKYALIGKQKVSKFRTSMNPSYDDIYVYLVLIRLPDIGTDILISMNIPIIKNVINDLIISNKELFNVNVLLDSFDFDTCIQNIMESKQTNQQSVDVYMDAIQNYRTFLSSLKVLDWSLFQSST